MNLHGFIDIRDYRVHLPQSLFPYCGKSILEVSPLGVDPSDPGWLPIDALGRDFFHPAFSKRNPLNIPGPFYGAETDTCETGPREAPGNVLMDRQGQEFVFKQPTNSVELRDVLSAALCECFCGYGADGDDKWTLPLIRDWWQTRFDLLESADGLGGDTHSLRLWKRLLSGEAEGYLRVYAFFVEEGRVPTASDILPDVS